MIEPPAFKAARSEAHVEVLFVHFRGGCPNQEICLIALLNSASPLVKIATASLNCSHSDVVLFNGCTDVLKPPDKIKVGK